MIEWSEPQRMLRTAVRQFVEREIAPNLDQLEHGDTPPYDTLRKFLKTFGIDAMAKQRFESELAKDRAQLAGEPPAQKDEQDPATAEMMRGEETAMRMIPTIELCRYCPGMVTAMGVSMGLTAGTIMSRGTPGQKERWALDLLTMDKIGAWAITEPNSGSDAFGSMKSTCRRTEDGGYVLNGNKTFITNGPYADTIVFICKLDEPGVEPRNRKVLSFVLDTGMKGLSQSKPFRKMGIHSSPTGELFLQDVKVGKDRLLGESEDVSYRSGVKDTFSAERSGVAAMALGITERCLELSVKYANERVQFGKPIGEFQLIQAKLAKMEIARINLENLVFRYIETVAKGRSMSLAEASAMKLYAAQTAVEVAMEAVQIHGGSGYMRDTEVNRLYRTGRVLEVGAGTQEVRKLIISGELLKN